MSTLHDQPQVQGRILVPVAPSLERCFVRLSYDGLRPPNVLIQGLEGLGFRAGRSRGVRIPINSWVVEDYERPGEAPWSPADLAAAIEQLQRLFTRADVEVSVDVDQGDFR